MKKIIFFLVAILVITASGCSKEETIDKPIQNITREEKVEPKDDTPVKTEEEEIPEKTEEPVVEKNQKSLLEIRSEIKTKVSASGAMDLDASAISTLYGIDTGDMVQAAGFVVMEGTFPHEAIMVEAKDSKAAENIEKLLNVKYQSFVSQSKGYDPENYALAQKCRVERYGNHISMFLTPDFEVMKAVYTKYIAN